MYPLDNPYVAYEYLQVYPSLVSWILFPYVRQSVKHETSFSRDLVFLAASLGQDVWRGHFVSITMASSPQENASIMELGSISSLIAANSSTNQALDELTPTEMVDNNSDGVSTLQLATTIGASIVAVLVILVLIHSRRHRNASKLSTPTNCSSFQEVTPSYDLSNVVKGSTLSTGMNTPQPSPRPTFKLSRLSENEGVGLHVTQDEPVSEILPSPQSLHPFRAASLGSIRSLFMTSFLNRGGLHSSLPVFTACRSSLASRDDNVSTKDEMYAMTSSRSTQIGYSRRVSFSTPMEHENADTGAWRDLSDTTWSIGRNSDSETESEWFTGPVGAPNTFGESSFVLSRQHLAALADKATDGRDQDLVVDVRSFDDSSSRPDGSLTSTCSPRSEQSTSFVDESSSFRQGRGLSALVSRWKAPETGVGFPFFSSDSTDVGACSLISLESEFESDSDESLAEEEL